MKTKGLAHAMVALVGCLAMLVLTVPEATAQVDNVTITKHNLSVSSGGTDPTGGNLADYGEICVYCHTPHGGLADAPLWNRNVNTSGNYTMYTSPTIDMTIDAQPEGVSLACLSCHDGTIGLDVIVNAPNSFGGAIPGTTPGTNTMPGGGFTNLGEDLRDDHPVSVVYDPAQDPQFNSVGDITTAGIVLFTGNKVQCASCHNPHESQASLAPFLRIANGGSALCKTCHIK